jgi:hypothetical protein
VNHRADDFAAFLDPVVRLIANVVRVTAEASVGAVCKFAEAAGICDESTLKRTTTVESVDRDPQQERKEKLKHSCQSQS